MKSISARTSSSLHFSLLTYDFSLSQLFFILWLVSMPAYCLIRLLIGGVALDIATAVVATSLFLFSLTHCIETRGWARSLAMLGVAFTIALMMEYLGSAHSFLFGNYDYTNRLGPKALGYVPVIIPIAWFMMLYPAWEVAGLLVSKFREWADGKDTETRDKFSMSPLPSSSSLSIALPFIRVGIAALAMTAWDLSLDPRMAADGAWVWHNGGEYFGIPLTNFLGWVVTSAMIYAVWVWLDRAPVIPRLGEESLERIGNRNDAGIPHSVRNDNIESWLRQRGMTHVSLPILAYIVQWLGESVANAVFWGRPLVALCVFVAMGVFAIPAAILLIAQSPIHRAR